jgi:hypothetical protein
VEAWHRDDLCDHDTIVVFDAAVMEPVASYIPAHNSGQSCEIGIPLSSMHWKNGKLQLTFQDGSAEPIEPSPDQVRA